MACVVAALLAIPAVALTIEIVKFKRAVGPQEKLEAECMADAEIAVGEYLHASIPSGDIHGPTAWSPLGFFIQGARTVHYANQIEQIKVCVFPRHVTQPDKVFVYLVQGDRYFVAHPRLKGRPTIWGFDLY